MPKSNSLTAITAEFLVEFNLDGLLKDNCASEGGFPNGLHVAAPLDQILSKYRDRAALPKHVNHWGIGRRSRDDLNSCAFGEHDGDARAFQGMNAKKFPRQLDRLSSQHGGIGIFWLIVCPSDIGTLS